MSEFIDTTLTTALEALEQRRKRVQTCSPTRRSSSPTRCSDGRSNSHCRTAPSTSSPRSALHFDEDLSQREIGEMMGVTESRVCQLIQRGLERLRQHPALAA